MSTEYDTPGGRTLARERALYYLHVVVYSLTALVALSLLMVGTVAVIAEIKGTWHWAIHLQSTITYMAVFTGWLLTALVPLFVLLVVGRWWSNA
jgi:hypothetical protein